MKTLIVYYSFTNNNELLAKELRAKTDADILKIEETKRRTPFTIMLDLIFNREAKIKYAAAQLENYDNIILVAPIWGGKIATPMKSFIKQKYIDINDYAFISVCSGGPNQMEKIKSNLAILAGHSPVIVQELWINDLLPKDQKNKIQYTTSYRVNRDDLNFFEFKIDDFIKAITNKSSKLAMAELF